MNGERAERCGRKAQGKEYWKSRLHRHGETPGRITKKLTHKRERWRMPTAEVLEREERKETT